LTIPPFRVFSIWGKSPFPLQAAFGVSSGQFRKAVHRNRIKRLCREAYRLEKKPLQELLRAANKSLAIFLIYSGRELPAHDEIFSRMRIVLKELGKKAD